MPALNCRTAVVFVGTHNSVFVTRTRDFLVQNDVDVTIIDPYQASSGPRSHRLYAQFGRVLGRIRQVAREIKLHSHSATAVVHSLSIDVFWLIPLLKWRCRRVVLICYGSDVLRRDKRFDWLLGMGLRQLDGIAGTNCNVMERLERDFPCVLPLDHRIVRFGLPVFDALEALAATSRVEAKRHLGLDEQKTMVCLGYSASEGQRQLQLIAFFSKLSTPLENYQFVVPVQYGEADVVKSVELSCSTANANIGRQLFLPLTEFHDVLRSALMRKATDVLINYSVSDAFSGTIQEVVYAGNLVLAISTLPYSTMPGFGTAIRSFDVLEDLVRHLTPDNIDGWRRNASAAAAANCAALRAVSSWDAVGSDWEAFIVGRSNER